MLAAVRIFQDFFCHNEEFSQVFLLYSKIHLPIMVDEFIILCLLIPLKLGVLLCMFFD